MNKRVGLWLDHDKAVIVTITDEGEERKRITSQMENYARFSNNTPGDGAPEDIRDRRFWNHLAEYYDTLLAIIGSAKAIQIFGPGEAKYELKKRLENAGLAQNIVSIDNTGKLTDFQIAAKVRERFPAQSQFNLS